MLKQLDKNMGHTDVEIAEQIRKMCKEIDDLQIEYRLIAGVYRTQGYSGYGPNDDFAKKIRKCFVLRLLKDRGWVEAAAVFAEANPI